MLYQARGMRSSARRYLTLSFMITAPGLAATFERLWRKNPILNSAPMHHTPRRRMSRRRAGTICLVPVPLCPDRQSILGSPHELASAAEFTWLLFLAFVLQLDQSDPLHRDRDHRASALGEYRDCLSNRRGRIGRRSSARTSLCPIPRCL